MTKKKATKARTSKATTKKKAPAKRARKPQAKAKATAKQKNPAAERYPSLPAVGSTLVRKFKGRDLKVTVLEDGFRFEGKNYSSLSGLATHITGYAVSGPIFFRLVEPKRTNPEGEK